MLRVIGSDSSNARDLLSVIVLAAEAGVVIKTGLL